MSSERLIDRKTVVDHLKVTIENCFSIQSYEPPHNSSISTSSAGLVGTFRVMNDYFKGFFSLSNCLAVIDSGYPVYSRLIFHNKFDTGLDQLLNNKEKVSFSGNYTFINGAPIGPDDPDGPDGGDWNGQMESNPVNQWDTNFWDIDATNRYMPILKGFDDQIKMPNPLYGASQAYHTVTLPDVKGVYFSYGEGAHKIRAGKDFIFGIGVISEDYDISNMVVKTSDGNLIPKYSEPNNPSYIIRRINKDVAVVVEGVVGNEIIDKPMRIWSSKRHVHVQSKDTQTVSVYTLSGKLYKRQTLQAGETTILLPAGLYIVKVSDVVAKVIISE
jgi:hypothetical protein